MTSPRKIARQEPLVWLASAAQKWTKATSQRDYLGSSSARPVLTWAYADADSRQTVTSDGYRLHIVKALLPSSDSGFIPLPKSAPARERGTFPKYAAALPHPDSAQLTLRIDRMELTRALKAANAILPKDEHTARLVASPECAVLIVMSQSKETLNFTQSAVAFDHTSELQPAQDTYFSITFLLDALKGFSDRLTLRFYGDKRPLILEDDERLALLMPLNPDNNAPIRRLTPDFSLCDSLPGRERESVTPVIDAPLHYGEGDFVKNTDTGMCALVIAYGSIKLDNFQMDGYHVTLADGSEDFFAADSTILVNAAGSVLDCRPPDTEPEPEPEPTPPPDPDDRATLNHALASFGFLIKNGESLTRAAFADEIEAAYASDHPQTAAVLAALRYRPGMVTKSRHGNILTIDDLPPEPEPPPSAPPTPPIYTEACAPFLHNGSSTLDARQLYRDACRLLRVIERSGYSLGKATFAALRSQYPQIARAAVESFTPV